MPPKVPDLSDEECARRERAAENVYFPWADMAQSVRDFFQSHADSIQVDPGYIMPLIWCAVSGMMGGAQVIVLTLYSVSKL
jgi:hypothetical protein